MTAPTPETLDWLRQCAAAPGARWHRALLAEVECQALPEIEPIPPEGLAWLHQSARVHGATYSQVLLHVLERIELLDKDSIEQSKSNSFCFEAVIKRLEKLEAAENLRQQDEDAELAAPTPEAAPVADDDEPQTLHTIALKMVDTLEQLRVLPEILDTLRRAIREPMQQTTPEPFHQPTQTQGHEHYF